MKNLTCLFIVVTVVSCGSAQNTTQTAPEWRATLRVVDEVGSPIPAANVKIWYHITPPPGQSIAMTNKAGLTDSNGLFFASEHSGSAELEYEARKNGYYPAGKSYDLGLPGQYAPGRWRPALTLVLKRIGKPIPMYARKAQIQIPEVGKPVGFDLMAYDWVAPYGKGGQADFIFQAERRWGSRRDFDSALKVTFSNPGDGLSPISASPDQGSTLRLPSAAPLEGYLGELSRSLGNTPSHGWRKDEDKNQNYYFRVRTVYDGKGVVKSALYGKIYGDFGLDPINSKTTWIIFTYYLNPEPNSRNVEFDPKQNLFKNVPDREKVQEP